MRWRDSDSVRKLEWRVIPNYPLYEMNQRGDVRHVSGGADLISTRLAENYWYTLQRGSALYSIEVLDLIKLTFPELVDEIDRRDHISSNPSRTNRFVSEEELSLDDEVWRAIPNSNQYEISQHGIIRNAENGRRKPFQATFNYVDNEGVPRHIPVWKIMREVWPEVE